MFNKVIISLTIIFSATFIFTENRDKIDFSILKKVMSDNELNKKKIESMKLMGKNRLVKKKNLLIKKVSKNASSKDNYPAEAILSARKLNSPKSIKIKEDVHLKSEYAFHKLTFMKKNKMKNYNSTFDGQIYKEMVLLSENDNRDCSACEFDWTPYGSECCDSAWDESGIDCATLESTYGWDCSGCDCPGDADPV